MIKSIVKYPGGKQRELSYILPNIPHKINRYYEPFVGGGAVFFAINHLASQSLINDKSKDLIYLYDAIRDDDIDFYEKINRIGHLWEEFDTVADDALDGLSKIFHEFIEADGNQKLLQSKLNKFKFLLNKVPSTLNRDDQSKIRAFLISSIKRRFNYLNKQINSGKPINGFDDIIHTSYKTSLYMLIREQFNKDTDVSNGGRAALYLFIRQYAYSSMFRYSKNGDFNVPYGGKSYNNISLLDKVVEYKNIKLRTLLKKSIIENKDFESFLHEYTPTKNDFLFLDPPYDSEFSTYDNNEFGEKEQNRLADYIINDIKGNWMLVIQDTKLINSLYKAGTHCANGGQIYINSFGKSYSVNFKNRNNKRTNHLLITNYNVH